jgi:signal transduction histidine kinase
MTDVIFLGFGLVVGALGGWWLGMRSGVKRWKDELTSLARGLEAGNMPDPDRTSPGEIQQIRELRRFLARGWTRLNAEGENEAIRALERIATYLRHRVESPLLAGLEGGAGELRKGADEALGAVEDLEFFLEDPGIRQDPVTQNLTDLVQDVVGEFTDQSPVLVKVKYPSAPVRVRVEPEPLKDAIFLILHNAGEFGGGKPVQITVDTAGDRARLWVADSGPGFSAEALLKAMDAFYSTSPAGLGLGLPHARKAVNGQGGEIFLRNAEKGGAEVEIRLPLAG